MGGCGSGVGFGLFHGCLCEEWGDGVVFDDLTLTHAGTSRTEQG